MVLYILGIDALSTVPETPGSWKVYVTDYSWPSLAAGPHRHRASTHERITFHGFLDRLEPISGRDRHVQLHRFRGCR